MMLLILIIDFIIHSFVIFQFTFEIFSNFMTFSYIDVDACFDVLISVAKMQLEMH